MVQNYAKLVNAFFELQIAEMLIWIAFDRILLCFYIVFVYPIDIIILCYMLMLYPFCPIILSIGLIILWY